MTASLSDSSTPRPAWVAEVVERVYEELFARLPDSRDMEACRRYLADVELPTVEELEAAELEGSDG